MRALSQVLVVLALVAGLVLVNGARSATPVTERVSVATDGTEGNGASSGGSGTTPGGAITPDGRYVVFASSASNLVPSDTNGVSDVFVRDRGTETTGRVSVATGGAQADGASSGGAISADGRYVAFASTASNLVPGPVTLCPGPLPGGSHSCWNVYVHDRISGDTERVSADGSGNQGNGDSNNDSISWDGRYVAFDSAATNLVPGDGNGKLDVFVHDRQTGATEMASVDGSGNEGNSDSFRSMISGDGRFLVFHSLASNLVPGSISTWTVFVHDRQTGGTEIASLDSGGAQMPLAGYPAISYNGRFVLFKADLLYLRDRQAGTTESIASVAEDCCHSVTPDGRFVAFSSYDSCVPGYCSDVFVDDRTEHLLYRVSVDSSGGQGNDSSYEGTSGISADGRYVVFESVASNLVPADANNASDVFVHNADADGDGYGDALEVALGKDPNAYCPISRADVNDDRVVNLLDLAKVATQFGQNIPLGNPRYDQNADNKINLLDLAKQAAVFAQNVSACP